LTPSRSIDWAECCRNAHPGSARGDSERSSDGLPIAGTRYSHGPFVMNYVVPNATESLLSLFTGTLIGAEIIEYLHAYICRLPSRFIN
jgi:hypothetical protein